MNIVRGIPFCKQIAKWEASEVDGCFFMGMQDCFFDYLSIFSNSLLSFRPFGLTHFVAATRTVPSHGHFQPKNGDLGCIKGILG